MICIEPIPTKTIERCVNEIHTVYKHNENHILDRLVRIFGNHDTKSPFSSRSSNNNMKLLRSKITEHMLDYMNIKSGKYVNIAGRLNQLRHKIQSIERDLYSLADVIDTYDKLDQSVIEKVADTLREIMEEYNDQCESYSKTVHDMADLVSVIVDGSLLQIRITFTNMTIAARYNGAILIRIPVDEINIKITIDIHSSHSTIGSYLSIVQNNPSKSNIRSSIMSGIYCSVYSGSPHRVTPYIDLNGEACLGTYAGDIERAVSNLYIPELVYYLKLWVEGYNINDPNDPYNNIVYYFRGLPKECFDAEMYKSSTSCYDGNEHFHKFEFDKDECDKMECVLRNECDAYTCINVIEEIT